MTFYFLFFSFYYIFISFHLYEAYSRLLLRNNLILSNNELHSEMIPEQLLLLFN